jgi:hypothetical protein
MAAMRRCRPVQRTWAHHRKKRERDSNPLTQCLKGPRSRTNRHLLQTWPITIKAALFCMSANCMQIQLPCSGTGLRAGWSGVRVLAGVGDFYLHHRVQIGSGAHPASYPVGAGGLFPWGKAARCVNLTTHLHLVLRSRMRGAISPLPNTPSWRCGQLM